MKSEEEIKEKIKQFQMESAQYSSLEIHNVFEAGIKTLNWVLEK